MVTTSVETYVAAVREELLCEYEARNMKDMLYIAVLYLWNNHDGE